MSESVLVELIRGRGAFTDALACVSGLDAAAAGQRAGAPYSVHELVFHMNYWMDYELRRLAGQSPAYPEHAAEGWPSSPAPASDAEWRAVATRFEALLERMIELARDDAPDRPVPITSRASHANQGGTLRDVLWQTLVHNAYHLGQVTSVRRMLGAWPPPGGGDTW
ncbi:MAG TPA: DinB family protein [Solirubrobacterales bacterium]|nr:DinB family protein [Solirubrobacterales bacterium]